MDLIEPNIEALKTLGVQPNDIDVWLNYEYQHQCAMEFTPSEMKRLSANGITLCIDCFQTENSQIE